LGQKCGGWSKNCHKNLPVVTEKPKIPSTFWSLRNGKGVGIKVANFVHHMEEHNDFKIQKNRFSVTLFMTDGSTQEGYIYLSRHAATHEGPEMVNDVMNQKEQFLPVNFREGATLLINREKIVMIAFPGDDRPAEDLVSEDVCVHNVAIHLMNHDPVEGSFFSMLPTHARRVKDFLNQGESFLELRRDETIYLINKDHILFVEEK
jgi:hypothetical protein